MWWIIIIGLVGIAVWLVLVWTKMVQARELDRDEILEKIATEYIKRRSSGDTMDQIRDSLYKQFSVIESEEFNPIPFGNILLASFKKDIPDDVYQLGEIAYTILCHETVYPKPREGQGPRECNFQFDALSKVCSKCISSMVHQEMISGATSVASPTDTPKIHAALVEAGLVSARPSKNYRADQSWKVDPAIWETMKQWSALEKEILKFHKEMEEARQETLRPPPKPQEISNKTKRTTASGGLFGTKWLMPMEETIKSVSERVPLYQREKDSFHHFGKYYGHEPATFIYRFENNLLTEICVCLNNSSKEIFNRIHTRLSKDFAPLSAPCPFDNYLLLSKGQSDGLLLEHRLTDEKQVGITEWIEFQLPLVRRPPSAIKESAPDMKPILSGMIAESPSVSKAAAFAALRDRALACVKCPHLAASRKNVVFGVGNIDAQIMFVGDPPRADEDEQGEPFVGRAGQFLTKIIQATGLDRKDVYLTTILKCRPSKPGQSVGNRKPTPEEMQTCIPYLHEQIDLIRPKAIIALGPTAVESLVGKIIGITILRGNWQTYRGIPLMPMYHPWYLSRNAAMSEKRKVWEDILKVMEKLEMPISENQRNYFLEAMQE
jgi:DNA polymerase